MTALDYKQFSKSTSEDFDNVNFMLEALDTIDAPIVFSKAGSLCRANSDFIFKAIKKDAAIYLSLDAKFSENIDFLTKLVKVNPKIFKYIPEELLTSALVCSAIDHSLTNVLFLPPQYRTNKEVFIHYLQRWQNAHDMFEYCPCFKIASLLKDRDTSLECLRAGDKGLALIKTSDYKNDLQFIYEAAWRYTRSEFEILDIPVDRKIKFLQRHSRFINDENWPILWEAIQYNPKDFFNPPSLFKTLTDKKIDLVLLASWALKNKYAISEIDTDLNYLEFN